MPPKEICIELRSLLRCANVFLLYNSNLTDTGDDVEQLLKINFEQNSIVLRESTTTTHIDLSNYFDIDAIDTICNLTVHKCNVSFRLRVDNIKLEQFAHENNNKTTLMPTPNATQNNSYTFHCSNCREQLTQPCQYARILAFPTGNIDTCDFFCHHGPDLSAKLIPAKQDLFYGFHYIVLAAKEHGIEKTTIKHAATYAQCTNCAQLLGEFLLNDKAIKLWTEAIRIADANAADTTLRELYTSENSSNTQLLQYLLQEATLGIYTPVVGMPLQHVKILLQETAPNSQRQLLLHVLEQQLPVLRKSLEDNVSPRQIQKMKVLEINLTANKCCKLLYLLHDAAQELEVEATLLLEQWQMDVSILTQRISPYLFDSFLNDLQSNALLMPEMYRHTAHGFRTSYIFYE